MKAVGVSDHYRTRFQMNFCFRNSRQLTWRDNHFITGRMIKTPLGLCSY